MKVSFVDNLLLHIMSKLLLEHLTKKEVSALEKKFGKNWFKELGYKEPEYQKPLIKKD